MSSVQDKGGTQRRPPYLLQMWAYTPTIGLGGHGGESNFPTVNLMPLYEYLCPQHGAFELLQEGSNGSFPCPICGKSARKVFPLIAFSKVNHNERLPYNSYDRVADRKRMMGEPTVKKAVKAFTEQERSQEYSPYYRREI